MGEYHLDAVLGAVADPTRRAILDRLLVSDARVTDLASAFPISLNSTSKHIKVLERARLVRREVRGRDHVLSLRAEALGDAVEWMQRYRAFWEDRLEALEAYMLDTEATAVTEASGVAEASERAGASEVAEASGATGDARDDGGVAR
ncbi:helix-turn-helix transcriptional regulator [Agromyces sp. LHK192]|uniref:ArsR/SmtB family transcription factor n=1 Tax=Agromyces sp. LHK192 TaxID=2498704 RepID=UPI000FDC0DB1|nr:metalloregulator ArsR/SmtB family transcription factor [Agromyces sp. LHK192]